MQFDQCVYLYLEDKQNGRKPLRPNTLEGYMSAIKCHLMPKWSGREMESITSDELQAWVDSFEKPGAARKAFNTLRQVYRWYLRTYKVRIWDETQAVELPTAPRRKPRALTAKQANLAMRDMRGEAWEPCALIQLSCGLRPCEAIALTWGDVNLSNGEVRIDKGLHEAFGEVYSSPTKTEKSTRTVVLPAYAVERLRHVKKDRQAKRDDRLCAFRPSKYRRHVRAWFARRRIRMCAQHLRHTYGTLAVQSGVPLETVALALGHSSVSTAYEHYLVNNSSLLREAQRALSRLLMGAAQQSVTLTYISNVEFRYVSSGNLTITLTRSDGGYGLLSIDTSNNRLRWRVYDSSGTSIYDKYTTLSQQSVSLHTVQVQNVSCGAGAEVKIATLPSGSLFIGIDASTGSSGKLVIRQYQTTSVYAYNTTNSSITLSGTVYYLTIQQSVSQKAAIDGLANGQLRYYTQSGNDYVQVLWTVSDTLSYFMQFNCTAGTGALFKSQNGTTTQIKSL